MTGSPKSLYMRISYPGAYLSQIEENGFHVRNCWHSLFILRDNRIGSITASKGMPSFNGAFSFIRVSNQISMIYPYWFLHVRRIGLRCLGDFIKARLRLLMLSVLPFFSFRSCHQSVHEIGFPYVARTILPSWTCDAFQVSAWKKVLRSFLPAGISFQPFMPSLKLSLCFGALCWNKLLSMGCWRINYYDFSSLLMNVS